MIQGVYTALITPFNKDESIDEVALRELVDFQIENGISGLVPMGTTGESPTVSHDENIEAVRIVSEQAKGRVPVIAGTGSNSTAEAVTLTKRAQKVGADYSLQVAPYYNKPTQQGFFEHFTKIADEGKLPVIVYNIPGRTGKNIENETMLKLAGYPGIIGVKEASGNIGQVMNLINEKPEDFSVVSGDDNLTFPIMTLGGTGVVSVISNLIPARMAEFVNSLLKGDLESAREQHYELLPLFKMVFLSTNPIPIKFAMSLTNHCKEVYRLPMCSLNNDEKKSVKKILRAYTLLE